ncbi:B12-binding domain-containing radical SAM protein, partial [Anaerolineae bacterium CFX7]|nr:B12-binding domain-containing radical SAM protein [Anaerolineae bacterium CFX7]
MNIDKVVLVYPKRDGKILGKAQGSPYTLMRLASLVPDELPVEIWDEDVTPIPYERITPHTVMGITSKTLSIERAQQIATSARQRGARVVVGGTHATLAPEEVSTWADITAVGEGYFTWRQILQDLADDRAQTMYVDESWANLAGVARLTDRVLKMVDEKRDYWTPYMEITRGCPRNCSFCTAIRVSGRIMRHRPVDEVVEEIERRAIKRFFLTDDNFGLNFRTDPAYIEQLFRALRKLPLNGWTNQAEMMVGDFPDLIQLSKEAHMDKFFIGFESVNAGNKRNLGGKAKGNIEEYKRVIKTVQSYGIGVVGLFVFGLEADTPDVFQNTWDFCKESGLDNVSFTIMTPYPGTAARAQYIQEGRLFDVPWSKYDTTHVTFQPASMTADQLREGYDWICRKAYSLPSIATRGVRTLRRHPMRDARRKLFSSFSTDF